MEEVKNVRLNKVLRELNISLERAVDFLHEKKIYIEASPNTKISLEVYEILHNYFGAYSKPLLILEIELWTGSVLTKNKSDNVFGWANRRTYTLDKRNKLIGLNLSGTIEDISILRRFSELKFLDISRNKVKDFSPLNDLKKLEKLNLDNTNVNHLSFLTGLNELKHLSIDQNQISDYMGLFKLKQIESVSLQSNNLTSIDFLSPLTNLKELDLSFNSVENISIIKSFSNLEILFLTFNRIKSFNVLSVLNKLKRLHIGACGVSDISFLRGLKLEALEIGENPIYDYSVLNSLKQLNELRIGFSFIKDIEFVESITSLKFLHLTNNKIMRINSLKKLKELIFLDISSNKIDDISEFEFILEIPSLTILADNNPCFEEANVILQRYEKNHYPAILNELKKLEDIQIQGRIPEKILLLGNHSSGKSTLLNYLQNDMLYPNTDSTHILKIENYPTKYQKLPKAIIYDFGGQDFYHGIYNAFLTVNSTTLLLWNQKTNRNYVEADKNNRQNINYNVNYWMGQRLKNNYSGEIFLIQTHADEIGNKRKTYINDYDLDGEFYVSLAENYDERDYFKKVNEKTLEFLKFNLDSLLEQKQFNKNKKGTISRNVFNLINHILSSKANHLPVKKHSLKQYYNVDDDQRFEVEIEQLHLQGMILVHRENVWLKPVVLAEYFHNIILIENLIGNGIIDREKFDSIVDSRIVDLLIDQKILYLHKNKNVSKFNSSEEYIIPNYLPLVSDSKVDYSLMTFGFGEPLFILKFNDYIPFGFINQMICRLGNLADSKKIWRDQIVFNVSFNDRLNRSEINRESKISFKTLIKLDHSELKIKAYVIFENSSNVLYLNIIEKHLFRSIVKLYNHNIKLVNERECFDDVVPSKLYISKNNQNYILFSDLKDFDINETKIRTFTFNIDGKRIDGKELPVYQYQNFTYKNLRSMKKVFVSYSNEDHYYKDLLMKNLKPLTQFQLLKPWSCEDMTSGNWHDQIQKELKEADIVIFMMSLSFITSDYILKEEVYKTFQEIKNNPDKKIICVLVKNFSWQYFDRFKKLTKLTDIDFKELQDANTLTELASRQFIPYYVEKKGEKDEKRFLKPVNKWDYEEDAYVEIVRNLVENLES